MNFMKILGVLVAGLTLLLYAVGSFAAWNLNPGEWSDPGRAVVAAIWLIGVIGSLGLSAEINHEKQST